MNLREQLKQSAEIENEMIYTQKLEARYLEDLGQLQENEETIKTQKELIEVQRKYIQQLELSLLINK